MKESELITLSKEILIICEGASREVMDVYGADNDGLEIKEDGSPVTLADLSSHKVILSGLSNLEPLFPVLSEEDIKKESMDINIFWLVDPLDGTKEFINKNGEFTVNVALIENGKPILGVVSAPAIGETFYGIPGFGSFKISHGKETRISTSNQDLGRCRITLSKSHQSQDDEDFIEETKNHFKEVEIVPAGSSLKLCRVAENSADIYCRLGPTFQWDIAAGQAVAEGSGAVVKDLRGNSLSYEFNAEIRNPYFYCAADPEYPWQAILEVLNKV